MKLETKRRGAENAKKRRGAQSFFSANLCASALKERADYENAA